MEGAGHPGLPFNCDEVADALYFLIITLEGFDQETDVWKPARYF